MLPMEVLYDVFSCLSRDDVDALQATCKLFDDIIAVWTPKSPLRLISQLIVLENQFTIRRSGFLDLNLGTEELSAVIRIALVQEVAFRSDTVRGGTVDTLASLKKAWCKGKAILVGRKSFESGQVRDKLFSEVLVANVSTRMGLHICLLTHLLRINFFSFRSFTWA